MMNTQALNKQDWLCFVEYDHRQVTQFGSMDDTSKMEKDRATVTAKHY